MNKSALFILLIIYAFPSWTQSGPYKNHVKDANLAQEIIHILDNSTVGAIQSVIGAGHIILSLAMRDNDHYIEYRNEPFIEVFKKDKDHKTSEVNQLVVNSNAFNADAYSLGLFQVGGCAEKHEGGHSVASAAIGPLYLPSIALSYLIQTHNLSFFEEWANLEADALPYLNTSTAQVGMGTTVIDGRKTNVVVFKFSFDQRQVMSNESVKSDKMFQWLNTKIVAPLVKDSEKSPPMIEFDLLKKTVNLIVGDVKNYLQADSVLRFDILTEQRYVHIQNNPFVQNFNVKALDWTTQFGFQYNIKDIVAITPRAGLGLTGDLFSKPKKDYLDHQVGEKYIFTAGMSLLASLDVNFLDYFTLRSSYRKDLYLDGTQTTTLSTRLHNELRNPLKERGAAQYLDFSAGYEKNKMESKELNYDWSQWNVTAGFRF